MSDMPILTNPAEYQSNLSLVSNQMRHQRVFDDTANKANSFAGKIIAWGGFVMCLTGGGALFWWMRSWNNKRYNRFTLINHMLYYGSRGRHISLGT